jgi:hypothetical protein
VAEHDDSLGDLLGFEERFGAPLRERLRQLAAAWPVPGDKLRSSAVGQVVDRVQEVFSTPLYRVLAAAWRKHPACRIYCDTVKYPPNEINTVELAEHALGWACEPVVEVLADGLAASGMGRLAALAFEIEVEAAVKAGLLTIQNARFITMESAELMLAASLRVEGVTVGRYEVPLHIPGTLRFGEDGEPICPAAEPEAAVEPVQIAVPAIVDPAAVEANEARGSDPWF